MPDDLAAKTMLSAFSRAATRPGDTATAAPRAALPSISQPMVLGLLRAADALVVLLAGLASWGAALTAVDRTLAWPIIILAALLTLNVLQATGSYRLAAVERLDASLGNVLVAAAIVGLA